MTESHSFAHAVKDARMLLDFMVNERPMSVKEESQNVRVPENVITAIAGAEQIIAKRLNNPTTATTQSEQTDGASLEVKTRVEFDSAYQQLTLLAKPVTVTSLKATDANFGRRWGILSWSKQLSIAEICSHRLWVGTVLLILLAITGEMLPAYLAQFVDTPDGESVLNCFLYLIADLLKRLTPFTYGGIGACAYLLKTAHQYIYRREFDPRRMSEYLNRVLLGIVSGGGVTLFVTQVANESGETVTLGASALGFLAGYNTDFLFTTIERVISAILPKVGISSVSRSVPNQPLIESVSLEKLLAGLGAATSEDERKVYLQLISKIESRL